MLQPYGKDWYEDGQGNYFNSWSLVHFSVGVLSWVLLRNQVSGLFIHTVYESVEGEFFASDERDLSMENHIGDTVAFLSGSFLASALKIGEK